MVDGQAIAAIVEAWTGIPARRMQTDEIRTVLNLREADGTAQSSARATPWKPSRKPSAPAGPD